MKKSMIFFILFICFGCSANNNYSDIELTWQKALVFIPGDNIYRNNNLSVEQVKIEQIEFNKKMPLLLYLHGCTGLGDGVFLRKLSSIGLVVIAPDSFARNYRPMQCNPKTQHPPDVDFLSFMFPPQSLSVNTLQYPGSSCHPYLQIILLLSKIW